MGTTGRRRALAASAVLAALATGSVLGGVAMPAPLMRATAPTPLTTTTTAGPSVGTGLFPSTIALSPPSTTTTTSTTVPAVPAISVAPQPVATPPSTPNGYGCTAALAYLEANANPEFSLVCPGYAGGNEAMTCINRAPLCAGEHVIVIADPCPAAYMNEAYNSQSWSDSLDNFTRPIDPYGVC